MVENLSSRQTLILSYFEKHSKVTSRELAEFLSVSQRTAKNEMRNLLKNYPELNIISKPGIGYINNSDLSQEKRKLGLYYRDKDLILQNYDRIASILHILLQNDAFIKYDEIAEMLFVSRSTLQKDMILVKKLLNMYELDFFQKPNYGVQVRGSEYNKRIALTYYFYSSFWGVLNKYPIDESYVLSKEHLNYLMYTIKNKLSANIILPDNLVETLAKKIFIAIVRRDIRVDIPKKSYNEEVRDAAKSILLECEKRIGEPLNQKNLIEYVSYHIQGYNTKIEINDNIKNKTEKILDSILFEIYSNFDLDFSQDEDIVGSLRSQIKQVNHRIDMQTVLDDKFKFIYFKDYLFATKITISAVDIFSKMIKTKIPMGEYNDFILIFEAALMKHKQKLNVGIYTGNNKPEELLVYPKLEEAINSKEYTISVLTNIDREHKDYDIILSNSSYFNVEGKIKKVEFDKKTMNGINDLLERHFINQNKEILKKYVTRDSMLYIKSEEVSEIKKEIINHLDRGNYFKDVKDKEFLYTEIGNRVVQVQDLNKILDKRICLLVILEAPVLWENTLVEYLILIKTKRDGDSDLYYLCDIFSNLVNNITGLSEVKNNPESTFLLEKLIGYES